MTDERVPADAWLDFTLALTQAADPGELQAILAGPLGQRAGVSATLRVPAAPHGVPLPRHGGARASLHLAQTPAPQAQALTGLLDALLSRAALPAAPTDQRGLQATVHATHHLSGELEFLPLTRRTDQVMQALLPGVTLSVLECVGHRWAVRFVSDHAAPPLLVPAPTGLLADIPALQEAERRSGPLFIDDWQAAQQHLPGSADYHVAAFQAVTVPDWPLTILAVGDQTRTAWTAAERDVFTGVARVYGQALERVARVHQLTVERATLRALVAFKERAAHSMNVSDLSGQAALVLRDTLEDVSVAYLVPEQAQWRASTLLGDLPPRLAARLRAGTALNHAALRVAFATGEAQFVPRQGAESPGVPGVDAFGALAAYPITEQRRPVGLLVMGTQRAPDWTERERSVFQTVGRSLAQAVDRDVRERRLAQQHAELQAQARSLQAFAQLSADLGAQEDRLALVRRAQEVALGLLPGGFAVYYEPEGEQTWHLRSQVGSLRNETLQAAVDAGLDFQASQNLVIPWRTGQPYYQSQYDPATDRLDSTRDVVGASATIPLRQAGEPIGIFAIGQYEAHPWTPADRALLEGVTRSLQLALDRAASLSELRRTTQDTARSNAALQAANEELEAFAYSVSHDLRAPVRHIAGFTDLLRRTLTDLDTHPKAARYLNVITESAEQMNALIDAMLALSRVTRQELHLTDVDLNAVMTGVQATLGPELAGRAVTIEVAPLPTVRADAALIRQVMTNLISNAVKYTGPRQDAQIRVWAEVTPQTWDVHVSDNGVGFDPAYAHKLFGVFQRLHRAEEFGGTGVGLANVRRIIQRHGGRVYADSQPGHGATFSFRLPRPG